MTYYGQLSFKEINPGGNFELKDQSFLIKNMKNNLKKID